MLATFRRCQDDEAMDVSVSDDFRGDGRIQ